MSKIFIAWSGNNDIAVEVAKIISAKNSAYECVVGGNHQGQSDLFVGGTILQQMKQCDQAILLIQKKGESGRISSNLMFEWGFLLAKLDVKKIHNFFIDISEDDKAIPSDLRGVWATYLRTSDHSREEIVEIITREFFQAQRNIISGNKMRIIMDWFRVKDLIQRHATDPVCSDYEMAQYLICYTYSASLFPDIRAEAEMDLRRLADSLRGHSGTGEELLLSIKGARNSMKLNTKIKSKGSNVYLEFDDFFELEEIFLNVVDGASGLKEDEVKWWILAITKNLLAYEYLLILDNPELEAADLRRYVKKLIRISEETVVYCNKLQEANERDNRQLCELFRAYMFRGMYYGLEKLNETDRREGVVRSEEEQRERQEKIVLYLNRSFDERKALFFHYQGESVSGWFFDNLESEYYLAMAELLRYETDESAADSMRDKIDRYVKKSRRMVANKNVIVRKIESYLEEEEEI